MSPAPHACLGCMDPTANLPFCPLARSLDQEHAADMFTGQSSSTPAVTLDPARAPPFLGLHTDSEEDLQTEVYREHHRDSSVLVENGETSCGGQMSTPVQMELTGIKPAHKL